MGWLSVIASDPRRSTKLLFWYWMLAAAAFGLYVVSVGAGTESSFAQMMEDPLISLSTAHAFCNVLMAGLLRCVGPYAPWLRRFALFAVIQQLLLADVVGAGLSVLVWLSARHSEPPGQGQGPQPVVLVLGAGLLGLVTLVLFIAQINQIVQHG